MGFRLANVDGRAALVDDDQVYDVHTLSNGELGPDPTAVIAAGARLHELAAGLGESAPTAKLADVVLGPPVPMPRHVFGVGLNYRHARRRDGRRAAVGPDDLHQVPWVPRRPDRRRRDRVRDAPTTRPSWSS